MFPFCHLSPSSGGSRRKAGLRGSFESSRVRNYCPVLLGENSFDSLLGRPPLHKALLGGSSAEGHSSSLWVGSRHRPSPDTWASPEPMPLGKQLHDFRLLGGPQGILRIFTDFQ